MLKLRPFQARFIKNALRPDIDIACLSIARGNGKSSLCADLLSRVLDPSDSLFRAGTESVLMSGSIEQCRVIFRFVRAELEPRGDYRFLDSATRCAITHVPSNTRLRVVGSNAKTTFGLVNCPWAILDEAGSWEARNGALLWDAVVSSLGKPGSPMKVIAVSTLAPSTHGWWVDLIEGGSQGSTYVQSIVGDPGKWSEWPEIRRCNPLSVVSARLRKRLLEERDEARRDSRSKARFLSYRLNFPSGDESTMLLNIPDFDSMLSRPVPPREGLPIIGIDLGFSRAFCAAVALWKNGRIECRAVCPGIPSLADQEKRDMLQPGAYQSLADKGVLIQASGLRVPPAKMLVSLIQDTWGRPACLILDRFRLDEVRDAGVPCRVEPRVSRWSESSYDIRALRSRTIDGPFSVAECSRSLLAASLRVAKVKNDDAGNFRLIKKGFNNTSRDDIAAALVLAAGGFARSTERVTTGARHLVV